MNICTISSSAVLLRSPKLGSGYAVITTVGEITITDLQYLWQRALALNGIQSAAPEAEDITMEDTTISDMSTLTLSEPPAALSNAPLRVLAQDPLSHLDTLQRGIIRAILNGTHAAGGVRVGEIAQAVSHLISSPSDIR